MTRVNPPSPDRPYKSGDTASEPPVQKPKGKDATTPPDANTEVDSEADIGDPANR
jgi:hypothetical protein